MLGVDHLARQGRELLETWHENPMAVNLLYLFTCVFLVVFAGMMSGLTLGLMSMDIVELEVLKRSGTAQEQKYAARIIPVIKDAHFLLVTLLLGNAVAMEALPIFLDKLFSEFVAIFISVTAVLLMGEIFPQAVCSKYGLVVGATMAWPVRVLMLLFSPIAFPIAKLLDWVLGGEHASLFRRKQLKALINIHAKDEGFGGRLTNDEIQIITGALDLTRKTAHLAMTHLDKVTMLSTDQNIDDATVSAIMASKPFSRLPVYRGTNRMDIVGVILVKELLEYVKHFPDSKVTSMKIRQLPKLSADTPMYDLLKLFRVGRSHMALLTQPTPVPGEEGSHHSSPLLAEGQPDSADVVHTDSSVPLKRHSRRGSHQHSPSVVVELQPTGGSESSRRHRHHRRHHSTAEGEGDQPYQHRHRHHHHRHHSRDHSEADEYSALLAPGNGQATQPYPMDALPATPPKHLSSSAKLTSLIDAAISAEQEELEYEQEPHHHHHHNHHHHRHHLHRNEHVPSPAPSHVSGQSPPSLSRNDSVERAGQRPTSLLTQALSTEKRGSTTGSHGNQEGEIMPRGGPVGTPIGSWDGPRPGGSGSQAGSYPRGTVTPPNGRSSGTNCNDSQPRRSGSPEGSDRENGDKGSSPCKKTPLHRSVSQVFHKFVRGSTPAVESMDGDEKKSLKSMRSSRRSSKKKQSRQQRHRRSSQPLEQQQEEGEDAGSAKSFAGLSTVATRKLTSIRTMFRREKAPGGESGSESSSSSSSSSSSGTGSSQDDLEDMLPVPNIAAPGEPIGIITIEDVIEELMGWEILDETDKFMDNEQSIPVNIRGLVAGLPDHLKDVVQVAGLAKHATALDKTSWNLLQAAAHATKGSAGTATSSGQPATSVLADLAGSIMHALRPGIDIPKGLIKTASRERLLGNKGSPTSNPGGLRWGSGKPGGAGVLSPTHGMLSSSAHDPAGSRPRMGMPSLRTSFADWKLRERAGPGTAAGQQAGGSNIALAAAVAAASAAGAGSHTIASSMGSPSAKMRKPSPLATMQGDNLV